MPTRQWWKEGRPLSEIFEEVARKFPDGWLRAPQPGQAQFRAYYSVELEYEFNERDGSHSVVMYEFSGMFEYLRGGRARPFLLRALHRQFNAGRTLEEWGVRYLFERTGGGFWDQVISQTAQLRTQLERYQQGQLVASMSSRPGFDGFKTLLSPHVVEQTCFLDNHEALVYVDKKTESFAEQATSVGPVEIWSREHTPVAERPFGYGVYRFSNGEECSPGVAFLLRNTFRPHQIVFAAQAGAFGQVARTSQLALLSGKETVLYAGVPSESSDTLQATGFLDSCTYNGHRLFFELSYQDSEQLRHGRPQSGQVVVASYDKEERACYANAQQIGIVKTILRREQVTIYRQCQAIDGVSYGFSISPRGVQGLIDQQVTDQLLAFLLKIKNSLLFSQFMTVVHPSTLSTLSEQALRQGVDLSPELFFGQQLMWTHNSGLPINFRILPPSLVFSILQHGAQHLHTPCELADALHWLSSFFQLYMHHQAIPVALFSEERFSRVFPQLKTVIAPQLEKHQKGKKKALLSDEQALLSDALVPYIAGALWRLRMIYMVYQQVRPTPSGEQMLQWLDAVQDRCIGHYVGQQLEPLVNQSMAALEDDEKNERAAWSSAASNLRATALAESERQQAAFRAQREGYKAATKQLLEEYERVGATLFEEQHALSGRHQKQLETQWCGFVALRRDAKKWLETHKAAAESLFEEAAQQLLYHILIEKEALTRQTAQAVFLEEQRGLFFSAERERRELIIAKESKRHDITHIVSCLPKGFVLKGWTEELQLLLLKQYQIQLMSYLMRRGIYFDEVSLQLFRQKARIERSLGQAHINVAMLQETFSSPIERMIGPGWLFYLNEGVFDLAAMQDEVIEKHPGMPSLVNRLFCCEVFMILHSYEIPMHPLAAAHQVFSTYESVAHHRRNLLDRLAPSAESSAWMTTVSERALSYVRRLNLQSNDLMRDRPQPPACVGL